MSVTHILAVALVTFGLLSQTAGAQDVVQPGARVRIEGTSLPGDRLVGTVLSRTADSLEIAVSGAVRARIPFSAIEQLEISRGSTRRAGAVKGMKIGLIVMGVGGAIVASSIMGASDAECQGDCGALAASFLAVALIEGAALGAGIGAIVKAESWKRIPPPRMAIRAAPRGIRVPLGRIAFGH